MNADVNTPAPQLLVGLRYALLALACATAVFYFQWRAGVLNPAYPVYSWIVYIVEIAAFLRVMLFLLSAVRFAKRDVPAAPAGLAVDVFVTTYNEPLEIVRRTVLSALAIHYPHETWLLDDGERSEMRRLAEELGCHYVARTEHSDAKAGNLNHGLALARGAFVAIFDADHVADPRFLDRTLGYFSDERLAIVQTPQEFFNTGSFEHLTPKRTTANCSSFFHSVVQRSRNSSNTTVFTGSSAVIRRRALDEISGFATGTICEDIHTSFRLHAAGWNSFFHAEILSAGIAALDAAAFNAQRLRWAQDAVQLLLRENVAGHPGLSARQRQAYLIHVASNLEGWRHAFIYALPIVILVTGIVPLRSDAPGFLTHFVPYFVAVTLACAELGRGHIRLGMSAVYNLARCPASLLAVFTAQRESRFLVTPKMPVPHERLPVNRFATGLLLVTLAAMALAAGEALAGHSPLAPGAFAIVLAWAAYHVAIAGRLLLLERRCARERRARPRFDDTLPATLTHIGAAAATYAIDLIAVSAGGMSLRPASGDRHPVAGPYRAVVDLACTRYAFEFDVREGGRGGVARWGDAAEQTAFDLVLHQRAVARFAAADRGDRGGVLTARAFSGSGPFGTPAAVRPGRRRRPSASS